MADAMSPTQGRDIHGTSAVLKSMSKLPSERFEMGTLLNQRLTPQILATDEDIDLSLIHIFATGNREGCEYVANHGFAYSETLH